MTIWLPIIDIASNRSDLGLLSSTLTMDMIRRIDPVALGQWRSTDIMAVELAHPCRRRQRGECLAGNDLALRRDRLDPRRVAGVRANAVSTFGHRIIAEVNRPGVQPDAQV